MNVHEITLRLHKAFNWDKSYSTSGLVDMKPWEEIESVIHEMAHAWCLGKPLLNSDDIGKMLREIGTINANHNEALALAVEEEALELLGVEVDFETVVGHAAFFLEDDEEYRGPLRHGYKRYESYRRTQEALMMARGILWVFQNADELIERFSSNGG